MEDAYLQTFLQKFQHLKIQLEEIKKATNNFNDEKNGIGRGGFGKVYKGEVSHFKGRGMVAIKRLDHAGRQGEPEFLKEITMLSDYEHENVISLLGFCCEGGEMILVYEYASRSSLDIYLKSPHLTWRRRLKICLDAAKGLSYLHDPRETHRRLIHCDVKSGNILLDDQWNAKVSDLGLSIIASANEQHSMIVTHAAGTLGYIDPQYLMTHTLTKESDVYSFGVVLFEVLCGRLCYTHNNGNVQQLLPTWIESYEQKKLHDIIFKDPNIQEMDQSALEIFSDIAYQCLKKSREDRPEMTEVVTELESALESQGLLESQEFSKWMTHLSYYEDLIKSAEPPLEYRSKVEFMKLLLSKGVLLNGGKTWFSLNKKGEHCEMLSFVECLVSAEHKFGGWLSAYNSRFAMGPYHYQNGSFKTRVKTQFLTPGITYTINLVFKFDLLKNEKKYRDYISLKYKLQGDTKSSISYLACEREDGWWICELYQFTSDHRSVDLDILFYGNFKSYYDYIFAEGIEFRPLEKVEHKEDEKQPTLDADANWEEKLPSDYEDIMKRSTNCMQWTTKKEAYSIIRKGFLIDDGEKWFSLDKNGKKCHMQSGRLTFNMENLLSLSESRFGEAFQNSYWNLLIECEIKLQLVSSKTTYASYLVYKLPENQYGFEGPIAVWDQIRLYDPAALYWYIYLVSPQIPVIRPKADQNTHSQVHRPKIKGLPQQRNDGWMEVQIWEFQTVTTTEMIPMHLAFYTFGDGDLTGLIIEGIEFRPI